MKVDPIELGVVATDYGYTLAFKSQILKTQGGVAPVLHQAPHLIEHIISEFDAYPEVTIDAGRILEPTIQGSSYHMFTIQKEWIEDGKEELVEEFPLALLRDSVLHPAIGHEVRDQIPRWLPISDWLGESDLRALLGVAEYVPYFLGEEERIKPGDTAQALASPHVKKLRDLYISLAPEQRTAVMFLHAIHYGPVLFPLALVLEKCTPTQYAQGVLASGMTLSQTWSDVSPEDHTNAFDKVKTDASKVMEYVAYYREGTPEQRVRKLVSLGENLEIEFKPALSGQRPGGSNFTDECVKSVAGFLNAKGGHLLIGVADDGKIDGLPQDRFKSDDERIRHLVSALRDRVGGAATTLVRIEIIRFWDGRAVCMVTCTASDVPVVCRKGRDEFFYVRLPGRTDSLKPQEKADYFVQRFPKFAQKKGVV